jgi:hypothetical protein
VSSSNIVHLNGAGVKIICLSYLDLGSSPAHLRHSIHRIRKRIPEAALVVGLWGHEDMHDRERPPAIGPTDPHVFSLREALRVCIAAASGARDTLRSATRNPARRRPNRARDLKREPETLAPVVRSQLLVGDRTDRVRPPITIPRVP